MKKVERNLLIVFCLLDLCYFFILKLSLAQDFILQDALIKSMCPGIIFLTTVWLCTKEFKLLTLFWVLSIGILLKPYLNVIGLFYLDIPSIAFYVLSILLGIISTKS